MGLGSSDCGGMGGGGRGSGKGRGDGLFARTPLNKTVQDAGNQAEPEMSSERDSAKIYFSVQGHGLCLGRWVK